MFTFKYAALFKELNTNTSFIDCYLPPLTNDQRGNVLQLFNVVQDLTLGRVDFVNWGLENSYGDGLTVEV